MPKAFKALRKGMTEMYTVPDIMKQATNIKLVSADGIFLMGHILIKCIFCERLLKIEFLLKGFCTAP